MATCPTEIEAQNLNFKLQMKSSLLRNQMLNPQSESEKAKNSYKNGMSELGVRGKATNFKLERNSFQLHSNQN